MASDGVETTTNQIGPFVSYANSYRTLALKACGWETDVKMIEERIQALVTSGQYEKAAGIALFQTGNLLHTVHVLNSSQDERLQLVATALASCANNPSFVQPMWQKMCMNLSLDMKDPYIRSMFGLIASGGDWNVVLGEKGLSLCDRIGVALRFLNDEDVRLSIQ